LDKNREWILLIDGDIIYELKDGKIIAEHQYKGLIETVV